jgi:hypothetical protein
VVITRRALVAAGAGALLAGCGRSEPEPEAEADALRRVLAIELALVEAYARVPGRIGSEHGAQERVHVARLRREIRAAGGGAAEHAPAALPDGPPLEAALTLERRALAAYVDAIGYVPDAGRRAAIAELLTGDAEHAAVLLERLGRDPLARAFADGRAV